MGLKLSRGSMEYESRRSNRDDDFRTRHISRGQGLIEPEAEFALLVTEPPVEVNVGARGVLENASSRAPLKAPRPRPAPRPAPPTLPPFETRNHTSNI